MNIVEELEDHAKRLQGCSSRFALKCKNDARLLAEVRNAIMTANEYRDDVEAVRGWIGPDSRVREVLDFLLIEHDARRQGESVDQMRKQWETRYAVQGDTVDAVGGSWEYNLGDEAA